MDKDLDIIREQNEAAIDTLVFMISMCVAQQGPSAIENMIENLDKVNYDSQSNIKQEQASKMVDLMKSYLNKIKKHIEVTEYA